MTFGPIATFLVAVTVIVAWVSILLALIGMIKHNRPLINTAWMMYQITTLCAAAIVWIKFSILIFETLTGGS